jgi:hypothetical protein
VHKGARCDAIHAERYIENCSQLLEALLLARMDASKHHASHTHADTGSSPLNRRSLPGV